MNIPSLGNIPRAARGKYVRYAKALGMRDARLCRKADGMQFAGESLLYYAYLNAWRDATPIGWTAYTYAETKIRSLP